MKDFAKNYIKIDEAAEKWSVTPRRVQALCANGKIKGAIRFGRDWMIPKETPRPIDGRTKAGRANSDADIPLPRKTPFLYMSDLYKTPGTADAVAEELAYNHEAQVLFEAEVAYSRGEIDKVYESANYLLGKHTSFYSVISGGMLLALCAIWRGDLDLWRRAKIHIAEAKQKNSNDQEIIALAISAVDSMLYDVRNFPDWFKMGCFEPLPKDALPAAKVYYAKYLYTCGYALATGEIEMPGVTGLALMGMLPFAIEPMISQTKIDECIVAEAYLRLTCAVTYHHSKNNAQAIRHIDRAIELVLPDRLYGLLAEYCRTLGPILESRIALVDEAASVEVKRLFTTYVDGWTRLNSKISGRQIISKLSGKYREVARLAAFKLSDAEIASRTNMSISGVKQAIKIIKEKSGLSRDEFAAIL